MGDRIGLQFLDEDGRTSYVLHSHWAGRDALIAVQRWMQDTREQTKGMYCNEALCHFLQWCGGHCNSYWDFDIQGEEDYDDCEDNGVFMVDLKEGYVA